MKAIIFGISGQDGFYLADLLKKQNIEAIGVSRTNGDSIGDVSNFDFVENLIRSNQPSFVFHLAANSTTRHQALFDNHAAISTGTTNILEAVYRHSPQTKVFLSGSAMQFKNDGKPIDEKTPFAALSPYAVSRIHSVYAGRYYRSLGIKVYVGYFFNHDSPRRSVQHVNQKIAAAAKAIAGGSKVKLEIGNISVRKEFNFAGDIVEAVWHLINQDNIFEAVLGSGKADSIKEWLNLCFSFVGENWLDHTIIGENFTPEYRILVSKPRLIVSLGWRPKVDIRQLSKIMMEE